MDSCCGHVGSVQAPNQLRKVICVSRDFTVDPSVYSQVDVNTPEDAEEPITLFLCRAQIGMEILVVAANGNILVEAAGSLPDDAESITVLAGTSAKLVAVVGDRWLVSYNS